MKSQRKLDKKILKKIDNSFIFVVVCLFSVCILLLGKLVYGENQGELSASSGLTETKVKPADRLNQEPFTRIIDMNGVVGIDGSLRVLEANYVKIFDLVEISTPVVAGSNHARIFLRADGAKQSLVIGWDDGTYTRITGN